MTKRDIRQIQKSIAVHCPSAAQSPIAMVSVPFEGGGLSNPKVALAIDGLSDVGLFILLGLLRNWGPV